MSESDRPPFPVSPAAASARPEGAPPGAHPGATAAPRRGGWLGWVVLFTVLAIAAGIVWLAVQRGQPAATPGAAGSPKSAANKGDAGAAAKKSGGRRLPPAIVGVRPVRIGSMDLIQTGLGTVTPRNTVVVRARVDGPLKRVLFREGQLVQAGEVLAEIDAAEYEVALQQAEGILARDEALLRNARLDLERFRTLLEQDSIARQQVDTQASLVRQHEGTLLSNRAQVDNAKLQLSFTRITAPISGRVGLRLVDPGNLIRAGDATGLVTITQITPITVVFPIPEDALQPVLAQLKKGARLPVEAWDRANLNRLASGVLLTVDNQIDTTTGTVRLKAEFANTDGTLFPNQFVNARLRLDRINNAILVPPAAIQRGREGTFVYALDADNRVRQVAVRPGASSPEQVAVEGDLQDGTRVVVDGADRLRPGTLVETAERDGQGKAPDAPRRREGRKKGAEAAEGAGVAPVATPTPASAAGSPPASK